MAGFAFERPTRWSLKFNLPNILSFARQDQANELPIGFTGLHLCDAVVRVVGAEKKAQRLSLGWIVATTRVSDSAGCVHIRTMAYSEYARGFVNSHLQCRVFQSHKSTR